jgi:hypothetical protein
MTSSSFIATSLDRDLYLLPAYASNFVIEYDGSSLHVDRATICKHSGYLRAICEADPTASSLQLPELALYDGKRMAVGDLQLVFLWMYYPSWGSAMPLVPLRGWSAVLEDAKFDDTLLDRLAEPAPPVRDVLKIRADSRDSTNICHVAVRLLDYLRCTSMLRRCDEMLVDRMSASIQSAARLLAVLGDGLLPRTESAQLHIIASSTPADVESVEEVLDAMSGYMVKRLVVKLYNVRRSIYHPNVKVVTLKRRVKRKEPEPEVAVL